MKFASSILLISVALAAVANGAPMKAPLEVVQVRHDDISVTFPAIALHKRECIDCTNADDQALDAIVKTSADHYSTIAHARLNNLMAEINTAKVTSGTEEMPKEKMLLSVTVQSKIDDAKKACSSEALAPVIKATVTADPKFDIPWSNKEEVEKKMTALDAAVIKAILDRIRVYIDAESLSKDCTEKMTSTEIVPAPATLAPVPETPSFAPEETTPTPETAAPVQDAPAPEATAPEATAPEATAPAPEIAVSAPDAPAPDFETPAVVPEETAAVVPEETPAQATEEVPAESSEPSVQVDANNDQDGTFSATSVDKKFVCMSGCKDSDDAKTVLSLRANLENEFKPRLDHFYEQEVPTAYTEKRASLLDGVMSLLSNLKISANVDVNN